ncbi:MAG: TRAP transporter small permease, partial [Calditrichaeota bacterium]|nr:TRAP transporter small permease [Calditrichota bacterium]
MNRLTGFLDRALANVLAAMIGVMVIVVTWQVITRFLLNRPSSYTEELATYLLIWISLLGAAYALSQRAHLGIDILTRRLSGRSKRVSHILIQLGVIAFSAAILVYGG